MTKAQQKEQEEAIKDIKKWGITDKKTIHARVVRVSKSGMSRHVRLYIIDGEYIRDISYLSAKALDWKYSGDSYNEGIIVSGCGMDMLFHTVDCLSYAMGYGSLNQREQKNKEGFFGLRYEQL